MAKFKAAKDCNLWTMTKDEIKQLQRGQWVYCCQPGDQDKYRKARFFHVWPDSGSVWVAHWQGPVSQYYQFHSWVDMMRPGTPAG